MGRPDVAMPDDLEGRFRKAVAQRYGWKKGATAETASEALELWPKSL